MNKKGVSLLEILISSVLLAMLVTGLMNLVISSKRWLIHNRSRATASQLGKTFMGALYQQVTADQWSAAVPTNCLFGSLGCPGAVQVPPAPATGVIYTPAYTFPVGSPTSPSILDPGGNAFGRIRKVVVSVDINEVNIEP